MDEAVKLGVIMGNPVRSVKPRRVKETDAVALERAETQALLAAASEHRLGAAVGLLFLQGWRVFEVLGLAWEDIDFDAGTAHVRRAAVYVDARACSSARPGTTGHKGSTGSCRRRLTG
jgi:integrase